MKKVSIIVPVYNAEKYLKRCIDSILNQTFKDFELILINDGSKDKSLDILQEYNDSRIRIIDKKNEGVSKTRNLGIKESKGKYIMFVDNDDYIDKDYVEEYYKNIVNSDYKIVMGSYRRETNLGETILTQKIDTNASWTKYKFITPWAKIFERKLLIDNDIQFLSYGLGEDIYFNFKILSLDPKIKIINSNKYVWFYNEDSVSNTSHKSFSKETDLIYLLNKLRPFINLDNKEQKYFINKLVIWYLLYSGRGSNSHKFLEEYERLEKWKIDNNVNCKIKLFSETLKGENFKTKLELFIFEMLKRLKCIKIFSKIYCKNNKK